MKGFTLLLVLCLILVLYVDDIHSWWGSSSSRSSGSRSSGSSNRSSISRTRTSWWRRSSVKSKTQTVINKVKDKTKAVINKLKDKINRAKEYSKGSKEMVKAYREMRKSNVIGADKYFHAKGNYNAAKQGPGGVKAAEDISNLREKTDKMRYKEENTLGLMSDKEYKEKLADSDKDRKANQWGRSGGDPNKYRVNGIPDNLKK
ncbi:serum amyloid A protein-like [Mytilus edulis]|uniref:serum amyloid A protein-like n=1 Tax=Mytilus edulis TaxID=6550 RepID=UPI0039EFF0A1